MVQSSCAMPLDQPTTLDGIATLYGFHKQCQCVAGYPGYPGYFFKDFLKWAGSDSQAVSKSSILTLDTLDILDEEGKTKSYRLAPVQGIQGNSV